MESPALTGLRSRSRSKTPFADSEQPQKSGRKTPGGRNTPLKLSVLAERTTPEADTPSATPARRTRAVLAAITSDYSSEEGPDVIPRSKEQLQNTLNTRYEYSRVTTSRHSADTAGADFRLSPTKTSSPYTPSYNANLYRSYSPAASACSTDSSFAEQALADISKVTEREPDSEHLPYKLYKMAGEYWNKYPKTDYTYSPLSRDRVELAPGQVAVPNMSRRSLAQYRVHGDVVTQTEIDSLLQHTSYDSSEDEFVKRVNGGNGLSAAPRRERRWWLTRLIIAVYTSITTTVTETWSSARDTLRGESNTRRHYGRQEKPGIVGKAASAAVFPLVWVYKTVKTIVTATTTTITNTINGSTEPDGAYYSRRGAAAALTSAAKVDKKRRVWPWLLLLLPLVGYASHYTYENYDNLALPDFSNITLDLPEFLVTLPNVTLPTLPNITLPFALPNMTDLEMGFPDMELGLPDIPEIPEAYFVYKEAVRDRVGDAAEYVKGFASDGVEMMRRLWNTSY